MCICMYLIPVATNVPLRFGKTNVAFVVGSCICIDVAGFVYDIPLKLIFCPIIEVSSIWSSFVFNCPKIFILFEVSIFVTCNVGVVITPLISALLLTIKSVVFIE